MFKTKQRKAENTAAAVPGIPRPPQTIINNQASEAAVILAKGFLALILAPALWWFLLYVVREMGSRNPVRDVGYTFFGFLALLAIAYAIHLSGTHFFRLWTNYNLAALEIKAEMARHHALTAAQPRPGESRLTEEDRKFCALLRIVMEEGYRHLEAVGQYAKSDVKPWSRTPNQKRVIPGFKGEVSFAMAGSVRGWLGNEGVINSRDEINTKRFPTFAHFEALLEERYYTPIKVQKALSPTLHQEVSFIENT